MTVVVRENCLSIWKVCLVRGNCIGVEIDSAPWP